MSDEFIKSNDRRWLIVFPLVGILLSFYAFMHDEHEVDRALSAGARIIGGNARDLRSFTVDLQRAISLRRAVPSGFLYVAESGVNGPDDIQRLVDAGVDAILVGSALMSADDPGALLAEWLGAVR